MNTFQLKIISLGKKLFEGQVKSVNLPTKSGFITILANHSPLISVISIGKLKVEDEAGTEIIYDIQNGVLDVKENGDTVILVENLLNEIDMDNLSKEIERAKHAKDNEPDNFDELEYESLSVRAEYLKKLKSSN